MPTWSPLTLTFHIRTYAFGERLIPDLLGKNGVPDGVVAPLRAAGHTDDAIATLGEVNFG